MIKYANGICLITEDVVKLSEFYNEVLQTNCDVNEIHADIRVEGGGITIYSKSAAEQDMGFDFTNYHGTGMCKVSFLVENVDVEYERLKSLNIPFMTVPTTYPWGTRSMHFRDLDGNIVCFCSPAL